MSRTKVLLPFNFTGYDRKAMDFVIRTFAPLEDHEITLLHAYAPLPGIDGTSGHIMDKLKSNLNYLSQKLGEKEIALKAARKNLIENGFSEDQVKYIFKPRDKDFASEIIDTALNGHFHILVLSRKPGRVTRLFTGSVFNKVVSGLANMTICLVT